MAKTKSKAGGSKGEKRIFYKNSGKRTSIGKSKHSRPKNKSAKRSFKKYRGQG